MYAAFVLLATTPSRAQAWWDPAWRGRSRLTFEHAAGAEDVDDLPVLVVLREGVNFEHALSPAGAGLRFVDADGVTALAHDVERWDDGGVSWIWVRVPRIDALSGDDHVWLYYDNPAATTAEDAASTWEAFLAVYHLDGLEDATAGARHGNAA